MADLGQTRPSTALDFLASTKRSFSNSLQGRNFSFSPRQRERDLTKQRDLLERMVQERDEKLSSLNKSMEVQNGHITKLHAKLEVSDRREKQSETRHEMQIESMANDQNILKSQLKLLQEEVQRIKTDPVRHALTQKVGAENDADGINESKESVPLGPLAKLKAKIGASISQDKENKITLTDHAQGMLLQGQLFQAMMSLSQLRQQTAVMKEHYDAIVKSLQADLTSMSDKKAEEEAKLLNRIYALDGEKRVAEEALRNELKAKNVRIKALEKRLANLEKTRGNENPFYEGQLPVPEGENDDSDSEDEDNVFNNAPDICGQTDRAMQGSMIEISPELVQKYNSSKTISTKDDFTLTGRSVKIDPDAKSDDGGLLSTVSPVSVSVLHNADVPYHPVGKEIFKDDGSSRPSSNESPRSASDVDILRMSVRESHRRAKELLKVTRSHLDLSDNSSDGSK
eukprot:CAMPEP_0204627670 /NCGR_PEP_ID=MMETSP0717-20131115/14154_1 /ASSEMBLY_ACC=CAM_ASM_000666 /TAXON_ID=230516 /ORGANISM="Chaetoceros curvisetus" /LENGTH=455 /DNA_ID=CAMNT_0051643999 /DNA_START=563 /DNA_END=1930 /DNA_ORIENTATION=-